MNRLLGLLFWLGLGYYLYSSGLGMALISGNVPQVGTECTLAAPKNGHIFFSLTRDAIKLPIDATIGLSERDRHPSEVGLVQQLSNGGIVCPPDNTKIKVLGAGEMRLYGCPYKIANVKILDGKFKGLKGWVIRDDVMDTPLAVAINQFRSGSKHLDKEMIEDCDPDETDPMYSRPIIRRRPSNSED